MAALNRLRISWSGPTVTGPGLSTFYVPWGEDVATDIQYVKTFFETIKGFLPVGTTVSYPSSGDSIDEGSGQLVGAFGNIPDTSPTVGGGTANYAAGVGLRVAWRTGAVHKGHRVNGSTFIVPISSEFYSNTGVVSPANLGTLQTAASVLAGRGQLICWARPKKGATDGHGYTVTAAEVKPQIAWLRTRRT